MKFCHRSFYFFFLLSLALLQPAWAQMFSYEPDQSRSEQALMVGYYLMDFSFDGENTPNPLLDFDSPVYGVRYTRGNFDLAFSYGRQDARGEQPELKLVDASLMVWGGISLTGRRGGRTQVYIPLLIYSGYRAVGEDLGGGGDLRGELFNFTTAGLGTGLGVNGRLGSSINLNARITPVLSLALRTSEGTAGSHRMLDAGVTLHVTQLGGGRVGLSLGYSYRGQSWNIDGQELIQALPDDVFDYKSTQQMFWVGINW